MRLNWLIVPTFALTILLCWAGRVLFERMSRARSRALLMIGALLLAIPGLLFSLYYLHLFDGMSWFYEFRSWPYVELTAAGAGVFAGTLLGATPRRFRSIMRLILLLGLCLGLVIPYAKPVLAPISDSKYVERWRDGVCLQSTMSSCGPACVATLLRRFGIEADEKLLAQECYTYRGGTECWYLARALRRRELHVAFRHVPRPVEIPVPAIAGVTMGGIGHIITILEKDGAGYVIGDPLNGCKVIPIDKIHSVYRFTGFFMAVHQ